MKVSIIVPVYNVEQYIRRCIDSIQQQTYKNIEIILIDDGSTDSSGAICDEYAKTDDRIIVKHIENSGCGGARNAGLDVASGEYFSFIDSDDFVSCNYVEFLLKKAVTLNCDIVQCAYIKGAQVVFPENSRHSEKYTVYADNAALTSRRYAVVLWGKIFAKKIFDGEKFNCIINEDEDIYYKLAYKANKICVSDCALYYYFESPNSIMRSPKPIKLDFVEIFNNKVRFFEERNETKLLEFFYWKFFLSVLLSYSKASVKSDAEKEEALYKEAVRANAVITSSKTLPLKYKIISNFFVKFPKLTAYAIYTLKF